MYASSCWGQILWMLYTTIQGKNDWTNFCTQWIIFGLEKCKHFFKCLKPFYTLRGITSKIFIKFAKSKEVKRSLKYFSGSKVYFIYMTQNGACSFTNAGDHSKQLRYSELGKISVPGLDLCKWKNTVLIFLKYRG